MFRQSEMVISFMTLMCCRNDLTNYIIMSPKKLLAEKQCLTLRLLDHHCRLNISACPLHDADAEMLY